MNKQPWTASLFFCLLTLGTVAEANAQILEIASGAAHSCAILQGGAVKCWGSNNAGQLGLGDRNNRGTNKAEMGVQLPSVNLGKDTGVVSHIATGGNVSCAIFETGKMKCWGDNAQGNLGLGNTVQRGNTPATMGDSLPYVDLGKNTKVLQVSIDQGGFPCALLDSNAVKCWGLNTRGRLGAGLNSNNAAFGNTSDQMGDNLKPIDLGTKEKVLQISSGNAHHCALFESGRVKCWGANNNTQLGYGDLVDTGLETYQMGEALPFIDFGTTKKVVEVSAGSARTCVLFEDGKTKCWGNNTGGSLGLGASATSIGDLNRQAVRNLPFLNLGPNPVVHINTGFSHTCVQFQDGKVKCFGNNSSGVLGLELNSVSSIGILPSQMGDNLPYIQFGNGLKAQSITLGNSFTCTLALPFNAVKCWGVNTSAQLGSGSAVQVIGANVGEMGEGLAVVDLGD